MRELLPFDRRAATSRPRSYVFGRYQLSADGTLLVREDVPIPLAPKVLRTLMALVDRAGEVVTKSDLLHTVWPDSFVEDTGLTRNISVLRQALGDDGQRFIATVPRVGYRFVATVQRIQIPLTPFSAAQANPPQPAGSHHTHARHLIVGRHAEVAALHAAFAATRDGAGRLVAVAGEPGIGKSTVVEEFLSQLNNAAWVARGRCSERLAGAEAHLPVLEAVDALTAAESTHSACLRRVAPTWHTHVELDDEARVHSNGAPSGSAERLMRELVAFFDEISKTRPLVIFLEDLHWADLSTIDVIAHLAARASNMRVLLVMTYRRHELIATGHPFERLRGELLGRGTLIEIGLGGLTRPEVREYVNAAVADHDVESDLAALVYDKTEGNPLFMVDLVRYLQEAGVGDMSIPESLRAMIDRTLQFLDPEGKHLLSVAAIHGSEFESAVVASAAERDATHVEEQLHRLQYSHGLIQLDRDHDLPDGTPSRRYRFVHVLYRDALWASIPPSKRSSWARQIAGALAASYGARIDLISGAIAALFESGRDSWQASQYFLAASRNASRRFAFREAIDLARRGLACVERPSVASTRERRRREFELTFALFVPLALVEGYGARDTERLTLRLLELGDGLRDAAVTSAALGATWVVRMARGECTAAKQAGLRMVSAAKSVANDVLLINAHMKALIARHHMGEFRAAQKHADAAITLDARTDPSERRLTIFDPVVASLAESSRNLWIMGDVTKAIAHSDRAVALAREISHPDSLAFAWLFNAWLLGYQGDWTACLESAASGIAVAGDAGAVQTLAWNHCVHGWALAHTGCADEGMDEVSAAIEASSRIEGQVAMPQFSAMIAEVLLLRRDVTSAERWLQQALQLSDRQHDRYFDAELHRLIALCHLARGKRQAAMRQLRASSRVAASQGAATFQQRATAVTRN